MTIHGAFNDIAENLGGTADTSGTIVGAIDALNDVLAGSDQEPAQTIEGAVRLLGQHIGGGGFGIGNGLQIGIMLDDQSGTEYYDIRCYESEEKRDNEEASIMAREVQQTIMPANLLARVRVSSDYVTFPEGNCAIITNSEYPDDIVFTDYTVTPDEESDGAFFIDFVIPNVVPGEGLTNAELYFNYEPQS